MMPNVGPLEIVVVLIIALIVFGPKKLPDLGHSLGKGIREFKGSISGESDEARPPPVSRPASRRRRPHPWSPPKHHHASHPRP